MQKNHTFVEVMLWIGVGFYGLLLIISFSALIGEQILTTIPFMTNPLHPVAGFFFMLVAIIGIAMCLNAVLFIRAKNPTMGSAIVLIILNAIGIIIALASNQWWFILVAAAYIVVAGLILADKQTYINAPKANNIDHEEELQNLFQLHKTGVISTQEYQKRTEEILRKSKNEK